MTARSTPSIRCPPPEPSTLNGFPTHQLSPRRKVWRVTKHPFGPWWFTSDHKGRFDLDDPHGTCYLAEDEIGALLETLAPQRTGGAIAEEDVDARRLNELSIPQTHRLADITARKAAPHGISNEICDMTPYDCPQAWASNLFTAGYAGIRYRLRHDPAGSDGFAVFGTAGDPGWPAPAPMPINTALRQRFVAETGVQIIRTPVLDELDLDRRS